VVLTQGAFVYVTLMREASPVLSDKGVLGDCANYIQGDMNKWHFSTNISLYFENGTRYGHSYNGRRLGTRMRSIERAISNDLQ